MPFAEHGSVIALVLQILWQECFVRWYTPGGIPEDDVGLCPQSYSVATRHKRRSGRAANRLHIIVLEDHAILLCESVEVWRDESSCFIHEPHFIVPEIVLWGVGTIGMINKADMMSSRF